MAAESDPSITTLPEQLAALPAAEHARFAALFTVARSQGRLVPPPEMHAWITGAFGSLAAVEEQEVVKVRNEWTLEGALFNSLRARRPVARRADRADPAGLTTTGQDPFCHPRTETPADTFGRIEGRTAITASNVAKYDGLHGVIIFHDHNPLDWSAEGLADVFTTAERWLDAAAGACPTAVYPFLMWNCLPRSGASQVHGHMQATLSEGGAYARVESWRRAAAAYRAAHGEDYFAAFYAAHHALGLAGTHGAIRWLAHLTPLKEKETILLAPALGPDLYATIYTVLRLLIDEMGVGAFNLACYVPPRAPVAEDWAGFPVVVRIVDRGDPASATSDIGAMELFAQPVVAFDPWNLARRLEQCVSP